MATALEPTALMVELALLGLLLRWRWLTALGVVLLGLCLILPVGNWAIRPLENRFPAVTTPPAHVDGIIVLGGAIDDLVSADRGTPSLTDAANRLTTFFILARHYPDARLVFTGGSGAVVQGLAAEAPFAEEFLASLGLPADRVLFEKTSRTTWENAINTGDMVHPKPGETWVLITSAAHMPRAMGVFRQAGWQVVAWPVGYRSTNHLSSFGISMGGKMAELDTAGHEWTGLLAYWLQGHSNALFPGP